MCRSKQIVLKYIIMAIIGCCLYTTIEVFFRGYSFRLMGLSGALLFIIIGNQNNHFSWDLDLLLQCGIGATLVTLLEAVLGNIDYYFLHYNMWDYSNIFMNSLNGKICLPFWFVWFALSFVAILLADAVEYYILHRGDRPYYKIFGKIVLVLPERNCSGENK